MSRYYSCLCGYYKYTVLPVGAVFLSVKARVARSGLQMDKRGSYLIRPREGHSWWKTAEKERKKYRKEKKDREKRRKDFHVEVAVRCLIQNL